MKKIFSYCDIKSCVNFGIWDRAILLSKSLHATPSDFESVQFFHYFKDVIGRELYATPFHSIDSIKFLYYNKKDFHIKLALVDMASYSGETNIEVIKFLLERCNSDTTSIRGIANRCNKEMYKHVYNNPTPWDMQLSCHGIKKNGSLCNNKASYYGFCGIHRKMGPI